MNYKKILLRYSILNYLHICFLIFTFVISFLILSFVLYLEKKLSHTYFVISEEVIKFMLFLIYIFTCILLSKIDLNSLELARIDNWFNACNKKSGKKEEAVKIRDINYSKIAKIRTFVFYSPIYFAFLYFPFTVSLIYPFYNIYKEVSDLLRYSTTFVIKANLLILVGIKFITYINTILIYVFFGSKKSIIFIISFFISCLYRLFILYISNIPEFSAIYTIIFVCNILFTVLLFFISIQENIRSNIYVE